MASERVSLFGIVQGVGFRPLVYHIAKSMGLKGYVLNQGSHVELALEANPSVVSDFLQKLDSRLLTPGKINQVKREISQESFTDFEIRESRDSECSGDVVPDVSTCESCWQDFNDTSNRRYQYPFTSCAHCGPRFSAIEKFPYDRKNTSFKEFPLCADCESEYKNPSNRRFHAQTINCSACGPKIYLCDKSGRIISENSKVFLQSRQALTDGMIIAVKGIGGFQLWCRADKDNVVERLRHLKNRPQKPFAVMVSSLEAVKQIATIDTIEEKSLLSLVRPIVLLKSRNHPKISELVAPHLNEIGTMLPCTPLQALILDNLDFPVIATSGNLSNEPICIDNNDAFDRLGPICDLFLTHGRKIIRPLDDSVVKVSCGRVQNLRLGRGLAPLTLNNISGDNNYFAYGGDLKSAIAVKSKDRLILGPHLGDLEDEKTLDNFKNSQKDLAILGNVKDAIDIIDTHPGYFSAQDRPKARMIQHHYAHAMAVVLEHDLKLPATAIVWDGNGLGSDGSLWGGEFFNLLPQGKLERSFHFKYFQLPGGETAVLEPHRILVGMGLELGETLKSTLVLKKMMGKGINSPHTSSVGRLFDAMSALLGICEHVTYEGEAAIRLEHLAQLSSSDKQFPYEITGKKIIWSPMFENAIIEKSEGASTADLARKFHNTLIAIGGDICSRVGNQNIVLAGGCFQNGILLAGLNAKLSEQGFKVYWGEKIPVNDGGLSFGQIATQICV